jgi:hypothetical protein
MSGISNIKSQLTMIQMRVDTTAKYYEFAPSLGRKVEIKELLQEYLDLYAHVYHKKPLREFGMLKTLDSIH